MKKQQRTGAARVRLPRSLRPLFWDHDFARLTWKADRDLIINRILVSGDWESVRWLLGVLPKPDLRDWLLDRRGADLSARQLRFWEIVLRLPRRDVNAWLKDPVRQIWEGRLRTGVMIPITDPVEQAELDRRCREAEKTFAAGRTDARNGGPRKWK